MNTHRLLSSDPLAVDTDCLVLPVYADRELHGITAQFDQVLDGYLSRLLERSGFTGLRGQSLLLLEALAPRADRILLIGCGHRQGIDARRFYRIVQHAARAMLHTGAATIVSTLPLLKVKRRSLRWKVDRSISTFEQRRYRFDRFKHVDDSPDGKELRPFITELQWAVGSDSSLDKLNATVDEAEAIAAGTCLARDLGNLPANHCTPVTLADTAVELARRHPALKASVLDDDDLQSLGMRAFLSVSAGSRIGARLIVLEYRPSTAGKAVVLVGKGVTFDSGGLSLKPAAMMEGMKFDMCGAAAVLGTLDTVCRLALPIPVIGIVAAAENMPGGNATRPGDVVESASGRTVEVKNTDAEGRLLLCDALTYAKRFDPETLIDVATLTGACVTALGGAAHGLWSNSRSLTQSLVNAGRRAHDRPWPMPLWDEYQDRLDSRIADVANVGGRSAGAITAACFLWRFVREERWAHLDVAGTAANDGDTKGATGRPVPLLARYLIDRARSDQR